MRIRTYPTSHISHLTYNLSYNLPSLCLVLKGEKNGTAGTAYTHAYSINTVSRWIDGRLTDGLK